jgi:ribose 5-phosphate isomerase B
MTDSIAIACDHGGVDLKDILKADLIAAGFDVLDFGTDSTESVDYPDFGYKMADAIDNNNVERGVLICGSGIGISMAANRYPAVRAATVHDVTSARLSREHNDANVICFGARLIGSELARECLKMFLDTRFEGGRHIQRVEKLSNPSVQ